MNNGNYKKVYLELLRVIACFFVIVNHTAVGITCVFFEGSDFYLSSALLCMSRIAVPIFLMISGAVLIPKEETIKAQVMRIIRMLFVFIGASLLYYIKYIIEMNGRFSLRDFLYIIYTGNVTNAFWYMYLYFALLIMLPLLRIIAKGIVEHKLYKLYFVIWALFFSVIPALFKQFGVVEYTSDFNLSLLSGYVVYFIAGYIIDSQLNRKKSRKVYSLVGIAVLIGFGIVDGVIMYNMSKYDIKCYLFENVNYFMVAIPAFVVFYYSYYLEPVNNKVRQVISMIGGLTFGTYLLSDLLIEFLWPVYEKAMTKYNVFKSMVIYEFSVLVVGMLFTMIILMVIYGMRLLLSTVSGRCTGNNI